MNDQQNQPLDFCRANLSAMADMITASLEATERLRTHQIATITEALTENAKLTAQVKDMASVNDLMAVSATLAGNQYKILSAYWSTTQRVMNDNQTALYQRGHAQIMEMQRQLATLLDGSVNGGPAPVVEAMKTTATAISTGLGTWARAAADSATFAATHVYPGNGDRQPAASTTMHADRKSRPAVG